jgi:hypothetical protein
MRRLNLAPRKLTFRSPILPPKKLTVAPKNSALKRSGAGRFGALQPASHTGGSSGAHEAPTLATSSASPA